MERVELLADELGISVSLVTLATDFYCAFPEEIDARIEADECAAAQIRCQAERREALLSP